MTAAVVADSALATAATSNAATATTTVAPTTATTAAPVPTVAVTTAPTNPNTLAPTDFVFQSLDASSRHFLTDSTVLQYLYSANMPHPGLSFWTLGLSDFHLTVWLKPPHYGSRGAFRTTNYYMPVVPFDLPARDKQKKGSMKQLYKPPANPLCWQACWT